MTLDNEITRRDLTAEPPADAGNGTVVLKLRHSASKDALRRKNYEH